MRMLNRTMDAHFTIVLGPSDASSWGSIANHYHSEKVVIVIVWLCNLHSAPGVNGEISP